MYQPQYRAPVFVLGTFLAYVVTVSTLLATAEVIIGLEAEAVVLLILLRVGAVIIMVVVILAARVLARVKR